MDNKLATFCIILVVSAVLSSSYVSRVNALSIRPPVPSPVSPEYDEDSGGGGGGAGGWGVVSDLQERGLEGGVGEVEEEEDQGELVSWGEEDVQSLTKRILKSLGLKKVPDVSKVNISAEEMELVNQKYLKHVADMERQRRAAEDQEDDEEVLLYKYRNQSDAQPQHRVQLDSSNTDQTSTLLYFLVDNLKSLISTENGQATISARLRLGNYFTSPKHNSNNNNVDKNQINNGDGKRPSKVVISVYHVTQLQPKQQLTLLGSKTVTSSSKSTGITLDVSSAVIGWVRDRQANHGLVLTCTHCDRLIGSDVQLEVRVTGRRRHGRSKRAPPKSWTQAFGQFGETVGKGKTDCGKLKGSEHRHCCRKPFNVTFLELGMSQWVIQPKVFNAYVCVGKCPHRTNPANNHAVIQSMLHQKDKKRVPKLCCAPSKVSDLRIWYFDDSSPPLVKESWWKGVVVDKCSCS